MQTKEEIAWKEYYKQEKQRINDFLLEGKDYYDPEYLQMLAKDPELYEKEKVAQAFWKKIYDAGPIVGKHSMIIDSSKITH